MRVKRKHVPSTFQRKGIGVGGRPLKPLKEMLRQYLSPSSPLYRDADLYSNCIALAYTEEEIRFCRNFVDRKSVV